MKNMMAPFSALAVTWTLTSCDFLGKGKTSGTKWNTKMTVDGTKITTTFRRFIKQLSISEKVTDIKSTITIDKTKSTLTANTKNAVVGLAFDFHTTKTDGKKSFDFVLIGVAPETNKFYIERYTDIAADKAKNVDQELKEDETDAGFDTDDGSMGDYVSFTGNVGSMTIGTEQVNDDWKALPANAVAETDDSYVFDIQIKQETAGTYEIYIGDKKVATYEGTVKCTDAKDKKNNGKCWGGAAVYANTPKDCKVVVKYAQDKEATNGLFADEEEF